MMRLSIALLLASTLFGQNVAYVVDNSGGQVHVLDLASRRRIAS